MSKSFLLGTTGIAPFYPAITPNYAKFAVNHSNPLRNGWWPNGLTARSFNPFWKFDSQFEYPNALLSGGVVLGKDQKTAPKPMLTDLDKRDAMWTSLLLDSGGYSIPRGSMRFHGDHTRREINDYCLKSGANGIMTLDIPAPGRRIRHRRPVESATLGRVSAPPYTVGR